VSTGREQGRRRAHLGGALLRATSPLPIALQRELTRPAGRQAGSECWITARTSWVLLPRSAERLIGVSSPRVSKFTAGATKFKSERCGFSAGGPRVLAMGLPDRQIGRGSSNIITMIRSPRFGQPACSKQHALPQQHPGGFRLAPPVALHTGGRARQHGPANGAANGLRRPSCKQHDGRASCHLHVATHCAESTAHPGSRAPAQQASRAAGTA